MPQATLSWNARPAHAGVVVLVMHGGATDGLQLNRPWSHNVVRLVPFARALAKLSGPVAVARLRFRHRGWNGADDLPLVDARWALARLRVAYPGRPIALLGHSMGGRVALHLGAEPDVRLVLGLSPWIEQGDPRPGAGCRTVLIHGDRDVICPVWASRRVVEQLVSDGQDAALIRVARSDHAMVVRARLWTRLVTTVVARAFAAELGNPGDAASGSGRSDGPAHDGTADDRTAHDFTDSPVDRVVEEALEQGGVVDI